jgi:hypothetical protein
MSDQPRPKRYVELDLTTLVPGDKPEAMEAVRRPLPVAPPADPGFTLQEQLEKEVREEAEKELTARNRERDELLTAATQLKVEGAAIADRFSTVLVQHVAEVGTAAEQKEAEAVYLHVLQERKTKGYNVFVRPAEDSGESL